MKKSLTAVLLTTGLILGARKAPPLASSYPTPPS